MAATRLALALLLAAAVAASQLPAAAVAANYTVGDEKGWNPDVDYTAWVKKHKPFYKGDWLSKLLLHLLLLLLLVVVVHGSMHAWKDSPIPFPWIHD